MNIKERNKKRILRKKRSRAKIFGTEKKPRLSLFRSNKYIYAQLINDEKGHTLAAASSKNAGAVGKTIAEKAIKVCVKEAVFHKGAYKYHGKVKAVAEEAKKVGLKI